MLAVPVPEVTDQVPPAVELVKAGVVEFTQTEAAPPPMAATLGRALTVSDMVSLAEQPLALTV